jgi:antirestriction protein
MNEQHPTPERGSEARPAGQPLDLPPTPEGHEAEPRDGPRIYVASLSDYNNGILHGGWIDADPDPEVMQDGIDQMLARSPTARRYDEVAEEWAIHDYEGFGPLRLGEYQALSTIAQLAAGMAEHGQAFAAWADYVGLTEQEQLDRFDELYRGEWDDADDYAEEMLDDLGARSAIDGLPEWLQAYVELDVSGFARDLQIGGDITVVPKPEGGGVWVWGGW